MSISFQGKSKVIVGVKVGVGEKREEGVKFNQSN